MNTDAIPVDPELGTRPTADAAEPAAAHAQRNTDAASHRTAANRFSDKWIDDVALMQRFQEQGDYGAFEVLFQRRRLQRCRCAAPRPDV